MPGRGARTQRADDPRRYLAAAFTKGRTAALSVSLHFNLDGQPESLAVNVVDPKSKATMFTLATLAYPAAAPDAPDDTTESALEGEENPVYENPSHETY